MYFKLKAANYSQMCYSFPSIDCEKQIRHYFESLPVTSRLIDMKMLLWKAFSAISYQLRTITNKMTVSQTPTHKIQKKNIKILLLLPLMVVVAVDDEVAVAVELGAVTEALVVVAVVLTSVGESGSEIGDDGGDALISSNKGDLLVAFAFGAPFNAELLANCKYADNLGNISLTSSIS